MSKSPRMVNVSLPLDLVTRAERALLAVFQAGVPGFAVTRDVFVAVLVEHAWLDLMQDRRVGKHLAPGPDCENAHGVVRSYVRSLIEEIPPPPRRARRTR